MKIGILTYHFVYNFGANLQALSTFFYFKNRGYEVKVINWQPGDTINCYRQATNPEQAKEHELVQSLFDLTRVCVTNEEVRSILSEENFDAVIIGSDAVIQYKPILFDINNLKGRLLEHSFPNPFMGLVDTNKCKVIYMSVSAQNTLFKGLLWFEKKKLREYFKNVCHLFVRDTWTQDYFRKLLADSILPPITPDPVFSFNQNCSKLLEGRFEKLLSEYPFLNDKYILLSFKKANKPKDETWVNKFDTLAKSHGYKVVTLPYPQESVTFDLSFSISLPLNPLDWYVLITNSCGYVGNNMHPIVTCIHNKVPFFIFDGYVVLNRFAKYTNTSSKIFDLLNKLELTDYYYNIKENKEPTPGYVFERVSNFNRAQLNDASDSMNLQYKMMMRKIESFISD